MIAEPQIAIYAYARTGRRSVTWWAQTAESARRIVEQELDAGDVLARIAFPDGRVLELARMRDVWTVIAKRRPAS